MTTSKLRILSWNIARRTQPWAELAAERDIDVALLQEAAPPPPSFTAETIPKDRAPEHWRIAGYPQPMRAAIAVLNPDVQIKALPLGSFEQSADGVLPVSQPGTLAVADVELTDGEVITVASIYGAWQKAQDGNELIADASVHRVLSDLAPLLSRTRNLIVAGDLNIYRGYGDRGSAHWKQRYANVFDRFEAMGLPFVGPSFPNGRKATSLPDWVPADTTTVPTYHTGQQSPETAQHQLDFVFASPHLVPRLEVSALNDADKDEWGPSDHCQVLIALAPRSP